jgi:ankyrin repeat protein
MVKDLLHFGTSRSKLNKKNHTPMQTAAYANHWECVKAFACIVDENDEGRFGCALVLAAHANQTEVVLALLPFTKNLNWTIDSSGATSLHRAIENTNVPMLKALLHAGANILVENKAHETPLDLLVNNNNIDPDLLQEFAAVPNASYSFGDELYKSARKYNKNFSTLLGCCPSQLKWMQNGKKIHALPWALEKGDALLVRELLQNNSAFVSFSHEERMNMTNTAIQNKQFLCVHELVKKDGDLLYAQSKLASQAKDFYLFSIITSATQSPELRKQIFEENKDLLETKMKLVKKIYISLRAGQSRFAYKTSYDKWEQYENDPLLFIEKVASYAHKWKGSRTEKAWELASSYENELSANALEEKENHDADISIQLFKNIYQWSFANSNRFFKVSKSFGETFYKSSTFDTALNKQIITPDLRHIEQSKGSHRSQRILTALRK